MSDTKEWAWLEEIEAKLKSFEYWEDEDGKKCLTIHSQKSKNLILDNASRLVGCIRTLREALEVYSVGTIAEFGKIDPKSQIQAVEHRSVWDCGTRAKAALEKAAKGPWEP